MDIVNHLVESCRCCSTDNDNNLIDMKAVSEESSQNLLVECFIAITGLTLEQINYNTKICAKCHIELIQAYKFRQNALLVHLKLQNIWLDQISVESKPEIKFMNSPHLCEHEPLIKIEAFAEEYLKDEINVESTAVRIKMPKQNRSRKKVAQSVSESECRLKCNHCDKTFETKRYLTNHLLRKHFNNMKSHLCDNCGLKFLGISELRNHIRTTHTNELPYTCHLCPRSYRSLQSLKVHLTSHSGSFCSDSHWKFS